MSDISSRIAGLTEKGRAAALLGLIAAFLNGGTAAETIISVGPPGSTGWIVIYNGQGYRVGWTQADTYDNVSVDANLGSGGAAGQTGRAYLTTQIGAGTSVANEKAFTSFTFPVQSTNVALFQGLRLPPGSYYLSIIGDSSTWGSQWVIGSSNLITGAGVSSLGGFGAAGGVMSDYFPASPVYADVTIPPELTVQGTDLTHPALQITPSGNSIQIRWTTNSIGFVLQAAEILNSTNWQAVPWQPVRVSDSFVFATNANGIQFYRLRKQTN